MIKKISTVIAVVCVTTFLTGCLTLAPHTRPYRPSSDWEASELRSAKFDIFPNDIRADLDKYRQTKVAWIGIVEDSTFQNTATNIQVNFTLNHHYFDWLEDHSIQKAWFFLSPRGEGKFKTQWAIKSTANLEEIKEGAKPGTMLVVYGIPEKVDENAIFLKATYIRPFPKYFYETDVMDYGRPGEEIKLLRVPMK